MKLGIIGTGYVGLVAGTCFAESGNDVICMDINSDTVENLKSGKCTIYEPLLEELLKKNIKENRLRFTLSLKETVLNSDIIFLCFPTTQVEEESSDISNILEVTKEIAKLLSESKIIVVKSTIPIGTSDKIKNTFKSNSEHKTSYAYNPEFLKEGNAVMDFMSPDRIIIGSSSVKAIESLKDLYSAFMRTSNRIIVMDERSAELTKYAANAMLASRISFMNEISSLCEKTGANIESVRTGIGSDSRIGERYLFAGVGYGGSCFPKDLKALIKTGDENQVDFKLLKAVINFNAKNQKAFRGKI
jgi:UDPglucose 6-dehydrogenase